MSMPPSPVISFLPYQRAWIADQSRFKIGMFARQTGKTFSTGGECADDCFQGWAEDRKARWVILSRGERQAAEMMTEVIKPFTKAFYEVYNTLVTGGEPRQQHLAIDGLILPADHPFWDTWAPPNGWGCSCWITGAHTMNSAARRGGKPEVELPDSWDQINPKTGAPEGVDRGWGYAPGASASDTIIVAAQKAAGLPEPLAADFTRSLDGVVDRACRLR